MASAEARDSGWLSSDPSWVEEPTLDLATLQDRFREGMEKFKQSAVYERGREVIQNVILKQKNLEISSAMCLGVGKLSLFEPIDENYETPYGSIGMTQLIAFVCWIDILGSAHNIQYVRFQDPMYNDVDKEFLQAIDKRNSVIESPESERLIDQKTFLFTPAQLNIWYSCLGVQNPSDLWINVDVGMLNIFNNEDFPADDPTCWFAAGKQQKLIRSYLANHVSIPFIDIEWPDREVNTMKDVMAQLKLGEHSLHYRPDSKDDIPPFEQILEKRRQAGMPWDDEALEQ